MLKNKIDSIETIAKIERLSQRCAEMSEQWCKDVNELMAEGEEGEFVAMASLLYLVCMILRNMDEPTRTWASGVVRTGQVDWFKKYRQPPRMDA